MVKVAEHTERKVSVAPIYSENIMQSAEAVLDSGYIKEKQSSASFGAQSEFSLLPWNRFGFQNPPIIEKQKVFGASTDSFQEVKLKFVHHEKNELGFTSLPVISLVMRRDLPADAKTIHPPEEDLHGTKWLLTELKYLSSPGDKKLIYLSW